MIRGVVREGEVVQTPFEYTGSGDTCIGCVDIIRADNLVAPLSEGRADRLLCIACWWLQAGDLPLPRWTREGRSRTNLAGVFFEKRQ